MKYFKEKNDKGEYLIDHFAGIALASLVYSGRDDTKMAYIIAKNMMLEREILVQEERDD